MIFKKTCLIFFMLSLLFFNKIAQANVLYIRGQILQFFDDPAVVTAPKSYQYIKDGLLVVNNGKISAVGSWKDLQQTIPKNATIVRYQNGLIMPGFIDGHIHYPQTDMIAANGGGQLLSWLDTYTFPFEQKFKDKHYAKDAANAFLDELLRNGTTTAMVFNTIYPNAVEALFEAAKQRHMRIITGEVMGDRNLPPYLIQSPEQATQETLKLIKKWDNQPNTRLQYAITFRFAPTTSPQFDLPLLK